MKSGYADAVLLARRKLDTITDTRLICERTGVKWSGGDYLIPWFGEERKLSSGNEAEQILWLHYITAEGTKNPTGEWIPYRDVPGARFYEPNFTARAMRPIVKRFGADPGGLVRAGALIGARSAEAGEAAITLDLLPHLPVMYILWGGDGEFEPRGQILFDKTAPGWLPAEDLVVLASLGAYKLVSLKV